MRSDRLVIGVVLVTVIAAYTVVVFGFLNTVGDTRLFYLGLLGLPLVVGFFFVPRIALVLLGTLIYSIDWISETFQAVPREATWLIDILVLLLVGRTALLAITRKQKLPFVEKLIYALLAFGVLSSLINGSSRLTMFVGFRVGYRYLGIFLAAYYLAPALPWFRGYMRYLFALALIQLPVIFWQLSYYGWGDPDQLSGTFGLSQTSGVALFLLVLITYMVSRMMEERRLRPAYLVVIVAFMTAPLIGEVKFFFMLLPLLMMFMARSEVLKRPLLAVGMIVFGLMTLVGVDFVITATGGWAEGRNPLTYIRKLPEVFSSELEQKDEERYERTYLYANALRLAAVGPKEMVLGNGPGAITQSILTEEHSPKQVYYGQWGLSSNATTVPWMLIEYGFVGTGIILLVLYSIFRRGRVLRQSPLSEIRTYGRTLEGITFLYTGWIFYASAWQSDTMNFIFWPLAGFLVYLSYEPEYFAVKAPRMNQAEQSVVTGPRPALLS